MKLSQITIFKNFLFLFIFSVIITSCEPEEVPVDNKSESVSGEIFSDTGNQNGEPETKP